MMNRGNIHTIFQIYIENEHIPLNPFKAIWGSGVTFSCGAQIKVLITEMSPLFSE